MHWRLKVSGYGKIDSAEIETAPLTLFVGDNNSGKSYLMSLLWAIQYFGMWQLLRGSYDPDTKAVRTVMGWLKKQIDTVLEEKVHTMPVSGIAEELQAILQEGLNRKKDELVSWIFNSEDVKIEKLEIELTGLEEVVLTFKNKEEAENDFLTIESNIEGTPKFNVSLATWKQELDCFSDDAWIKIILGIVSGIDPVGRSGTSIFLPAARTGFMLTKDVINKVGRNFLCSAGTGERHSPQGCFSGGYGTFPIDFDVKAS